MAVALALSLNGEMAIAESRTVTATRDFVLHEFSDPFAEGIIGYSISTNSIRFDKYGLGPNDFASLIFNSDVQDFIEEIIEQRFRSINPSYPRECADYAPESVNGCEEKNILISMKFSMKTDRKDLITICHEKHSGPFGNCNVDRRISCHSGAGNATPTKLRECVFDGLAKFNFFYPSDKLSHYLTGERLYLRLELIETSNYTTDEIDYQVLGQFDFPAVDLAGVEGIFSHRDRLANETLTK